MISTTGTLFQKKKILWYLSELDFVIENFLQELCEELKCLIFINPIKDFLLHVPPVYIQFMFLIVIPSVLHQTTLAEAMLY